MWYRVTLQNLEVHKLRLERVAECRLRVSVAQGPLGKFPAVDEEALTRVVKCRKNEVIGGLREELMLRADSHRPILVAMTLEDGDGKERGIAAKQARNLAKRLVSGTAGGVAGAVAQELVSRVVRKIREPDPLAYIAFWLVPNAEELSTQGDYEFTLEPNNGKNSGRAIVKWESVG